MSDTIQAGTAPGSQLGDLARFDKFFGAPAAPAPQDATPPPGTTAPAAGAPEVPVVPEAPVAQVGQQPVVGQQATESAPAETGLAAKIRAEREAKAAKAKHEAEARSWQEKYETAQAQLSKVNKADVVADTVGWAEAQGLTREEQAIVGQTLLYGLVPDKATPEVRIELMEARQARKAKLAAEEAARKEAAEATARVQETHQRYIEALASSVESLPPGGTTYPESETWFGEDREAYVRSLYATADNMAEYARASGQGCDLSFGAVAKVLESDLAVRASRLRSRGAAPQVKQEEPPAPIGKPPEPQVTATGISGGSPPRPPAKTDAERLQRASELVFRTK